MKRIGIFLAALALAVVAGCGATLHKPTTPGNAGTSALVAYATAGFTAGKYLAMDLCATPPVYPCKTQVINDKVLLADTAAYLAAKAADAAGDAAQAAPEIDALKQLNASPEVHDQVKLTKGEPQ
jgi:hypothetical protein